LILINKNATINHLIIINFQYIDNNNIELVDNSGNYTNQREVTKRFKVLPGYYLIIPSMFYEDKDGEFLLRIFTENKVESK
jgi:hypothetical protein